MTNSNAAYLCQRLLGLSKSSEYEGQSEPGRLIGPELSKCDFLVFKNDHAPSHSERANVFFRARSSITFHAAAGRSFRIRTVGVRLFPGHHVSPQLLNLLRFQQTSPRRHAVLSVRHGIDKARVLIVRKSPEVERPLRVGHVRPVAGRAVSRKYRRARADLLRGKFARRRLPRGRRCTHKCQSPSNRNRAFHPSGSKRWIKYRFIAPERTSRRIHLAAHSSEIPAPRSNRARQCRTRP